MCCIFPPHLYIPSYCTQVQWYVRHSSSCTPTSEISILEFIKSWTLLQLMAFWHGTPQQNVCCWPDIPARANNMPIMMMSVASDRVWCVVVGRPVPKLVASIPSVWHHYVVVMTLLFLLLLSALLEISKLLTGWLVLRLVSSVCSAWHQSFIDRMISS